MSNDVKNYVCLIFDREDVARGVHSIRDMLLDDAIRAASNLANSVQDSRGFQLWSAGKLIVSQLSKGGRPWAEMLVVSRTPN